VYKNQDSKFKNIGISFEGIYEILLSILKFVPFVIFLNYYIDIKGLRAEIANTYIVSGAYALLVMIVLKASGQIIDRIIVSMHWYLAVAGLAYFLQIYPVIRLVTWLGESGILATTIIVGFLSILFSPYGFIGKDCEDRIGVYIQSFNLLIVTVLAFTLSVHYKGDFMVSFVLPLACVFYFDWYFKRRA